ncbi:MAG TPA: PEP-CTERM-box response regulator transcription factor [Candidatus Methanoperedens sp.]|nr:PEP-CTERM-box response regulator transcription factor [Candidatus Methanoperedens sp.]
MTKPTNNLGTAAKPNLLIIDDEESIRTQLKWALAKEYEVLAAEDRPRALEIFLAERPEVVILDLGLPPHADDVVEGFAALEAMRREDELVKVIVSSGRSERENALQAIGRGAYDFLPKPVQVDELRLILARAFHVARLEREYRELQQQVAARSYEGMLGASPRMSEVFTAIRKVATTDAPVLITGENGTGKELAALAIHRAGERRDGPFVAINCGAIPETLLESELFGHEKGAFTGAHIQRKGRVELAQGGTLFLDEIGDLSAPLQVKLLRFLQEHRIERVGGREQIEVDVRVIAATNRDLKTAMREGRFREDLYYRLGVVVIALPPLRDREGDIPLLATTMLQRYCAEAKKKVSAFTPQALRAMERHPWPGNVRELENRVKRAVIMAEGTKITPADLDLDSAAARYEGTTLKEVRDAVEKEFVQRALKRHGGNVTRAAAELDISRPTMYELMEKLGIPRD